MATLRLVLLSPQRAHPCQAHNPLIQTPASLTYPSVMLAPPTRHPLNPCAHTQSLLRSSSAKHDSGVQGLLEARDRNQAELCRLDAAQRRLLNKCFSYDNWVEAFRRSGK